jgi:RimJ/RimL family protein N-acetyltransferase
MNIIETERLSLRKFVDDIDDARFIFELLNTDDWKKNIGDRNIHTIEDAFNYINTKMLKAYENEGYGFYLLENNNTKEKLGTAGVLKRDHMDYADFGYALLPDHYGKGYAYEISIAILEYAHEILKLEKIQAIVNHDNLPSIKVLQKCGLTFINSKKIDENNEVDVYELTF